MFINPLVQEAANASPQMGMLFLAAYIRQRFPQYEFKFADWTALRLSEEEQKRILMDNQPGLVGMTTFTPYLRQALKLAKLVKETLPECKVIFGGPHVTARPDDSYPNVDHIITGEGELAFEKFLHLYESGAEIPRLMVNTEYLADIDFLPAWDLVEDWSPYTPRGFFFGVQSQMWVLASRGCPFNCTFCANVVFNKARPRQRFRSPSSVIEEIRCHQSLHKVRGLYFADDEFNTNVKWTESICKALMDNNIQLPWSASMRTSKKLFPEHLIQTMSQANCQAVALGIESGNNEVLNSIRKKTTVEENLRALELLKKHNILAHGMFIIGHAWYGEDGQPDGETIEQVQDTLDFIKTASKSGLLPSVSISICKPMPGSCVGSIAEEFDLLYDKEGSDIDLDSIIRQKVVFKHPHLSDEQIQSSYQKAWESVAFNVPNMMRRFLIFSNPIEMIDNAKMGLFVARKLIRGRLNLSKVRS